MDVATQKVYLQLTAMTLRDKQNVPQSIPKECEGRSQAAQRSQESGHLELGAGVREVFGEAHYTAAHHPEPHERPEGVPATDFHLYAQHTS
jgi:hypothetical protein